MKYSYKNISLSIFAVIMFACLAVIAGSAMAYSGSGGSMDSRYLSSSHSSYGYRLASWNYSKNIYKKSVFCEGSARYCAKKNNCGNGGCNSDENEYSCSQDCNQKPICSRKLSGSPSNKEKKECEKNNGYIYCGNGWCSCSCSDQPVCGNNKCESGENKRNCPQDCGYYNICGQQLSGSPSNGEITNCEKHNGRILCGNGWCTCNCQSQPICGNGTCENGETASNCADDCSACVRSGNSCCKGNICNSMSLDCASGYIPKFTGCNSNCVVQAKCEKKPPICGNDACEDGESKNNCQKDCGWTDICGQTLSGSPTHREKQDCNDKNGQILCGNGWCKCNCGSGKYTTGTLTVYEQTGGVSKHSYNIPDLLNSARSFATSAGEKYTVRFDGKKLTINCYRNNHLSGQAVGNNIVAAKIEVPGTSQPIWASKIISYTLGYNGIAESRFNALGNNTEYGPYKGSLCTYLGDQDSEIVLGF